MCCGAVGPHGYCLTHDLQYANWRIWRDALEHEDLAAAGVPPGREPEPQAGAALDTLWRHLTPGPFQKPGEQARDPRPTAGLPKPHRKATETPPKRHRPR